jgi:hypothetical protein
MIQSLTGMSSWEEATDFNHTKKCFFKQTTLQGKIRLLEDLFSGPQAYTPLHDTRMLKLVEANIVI